MSFAGLADLSTRSGVVQTSDVSLCSMQKNSESTSLSTRVIASTHPQKFDHSREELAKVGEEDEEERDADDGVENREDATRCRYRTDVTVACVGERENDILR